MPVSAHKLPLYETWRAYRQPRGITDCGVCAELLDQAAGGFDGFGNEERGVAVVVGEVWVAVVRLYE